MTKSATAICALIGAAVIGALLGFTKLPDPPVEASVSPETIAHQTACRGWLIAETSSGLRDQIEGVRTDYYDPGKVRSVFLQTKSALAGAASVPQLDHVTFEAFRDGIVALEEVRSNYGRYNNVTAEARLPGALIHLDTALATITSLCSEG